MALKITDKQIFTLQETAEIVGKDKSTVGRWREKGIFTAEPNGNNSYDVQAAEVQRILDYIERKKGKTATKSATGKNKNATATKGKGRAVAKKAQLENRITELEHEQELLQQSYDSMEDQKNKLNEIIEDKNATIEDQRKQINHFQDKEKQFILLEDKREDNAQALQKIIEQNTQRKSGVGGLIAAAVVGVLVTAGIFLATGYISFSGAPNEVASINPAAGIETPVEAPTAQINTIPETVIVDPLKPEGQQSLAPEFRE